MTQAEKVIVTSLNTVLKESVKDLETIFVVIPPDHNYLVL